MLFTRVSGTEPKLKIIYTLRQKLKQILEDVSICYSVTVLKSK